ncbi:hypothetical protein [Streptomyces sp. NPDC101166]|uniref:hypothetical protein n=1 Tax=Streptomyces sp. NPDC101166 TaxID=3366120 RepID=UPI0038173E4A
MKIPAGRGGYLAVLRVELSPAGGGGDAPPGYVGRGLGPSGVGSDGFGVEAHEVHDTSFFS